MDTPSTYSSICYVPSPALLPTFPFIHPCILLKRIKVIKFGNAKRFGLIDRCPIGLDERNFQSIQLSVLLKLRKLEPFFDTLICRLECVITIRVEANRFESESRFRRMRVHTDRFKCKPVCANPTAFQYSKNSAQVKKYRAMENYRLILLHTIMWGGQVRLDQVRLGRRRRNVWLQPLT